MFKRGKYGVKTSSGSSAAKKQKVVDPASGNLRKFRKRVIYILLVLYIKGNLRTREHLRKNTRSRETRMRDT